jgi:hypothetical protein
VPLAGQNSFPVPAVDILMPNQAGNGMKREFGCPGPFLSIIQEQGDGT